MSRPAWDGVMWWERRIRTRPDLPLWLAVLLLVVALVVYAVAARYEVAGSQQVPGPTVAVTAPLQAQADVNDAAMAAFYETLPSPGSVPDILGTLFSLGGRHGVGLAQGDYRLDPAEGGIIRCHLRFPLTGDTARLEAFIWAALKELPALALEGVAFQRKSANQSDSEAEIRFTLFLRADAIADAGGASR